jgi:hypothetical protein
MASVQTGGSVTTLEGRSGPGIVTPSGRCRRTGSPRRPLAMRAWLAAALTTAAASVAPVHGQDAAVAELPTVASTEAGGHVGKQVRVELVVASSRLMADRGVCFLNSRKDHRDDDNFTVVIFRDGLGRFAEAGIDDPAGRFDARTIRVRGTVAERNGKPQIVVELPDQIEIIESADE